MRRSIIREKSILSPYALALKQVALKGKVALGPSAKYQELMMHLKGTLPADYKAPLNGKWDDTIERWTYAWQFPISEKSETTSEAVLKLPAFGKVQRFTRKLIESPPQRLPPTAASIWQRPADESERIESLREQRKQLESEAAKTTTSHAGATGPESGSSHDLNDEEVLEEDPMDLIIAQVEKANDLANAADIPLAYIDDGTELTIASRELGSLLVEELGLSYDVKGVTTAISCVGRFDLESGVQLFNFAKEIGFTPDAATYNVLMSHYAHVGDVNKCVTFLEEMKGEGITPTRHTWVTLMRAFHRAGDYGAVFQVVENMKAFANIEPDETVFLQQFHALAADKTKENAAFEAVTLWDQMENVYGYIPTRQLYTAYLSCLARTKHPDMVTRVDEIGKKMELLGVLWDADVYAQLLSSAETCGNIKKMRELFAKMRNQRVQMNLSHLSSAIRCYRNALSPSIFPYTEYRDQNKSPLPVWLEYLTTCYGMYELVLQRGWTVNVSFLNALLGISSSVACLSMEYLTDDKVAIAKFEAQVETLWNHTYTDLRVKKNAVTYQHYIQMLCHQQRIDAAEKLFQELVLDDDVTPTAKTYEEMMWMHMKSGEEGGTARAINYLEAMERAKIPIKARVIKQMVKVNNDAGYKRDMKRRARRIMQAREEYMARKAEGLETQPVEYKPPETTEEGLPALTPLPLSANSTLAWWEKWKRESINKHELFETEKEDGTPRGEDFAEKNEALAKMGIETSFPTKDLVPDKKKHILTKKFQEEEGSNPAGSLWALDGGELSYPKPGMDPEGWGTTLWRERRIIEKQIALVRAGKAEMPPLSTEGNAMRVAPDQLAIEKSGVKTPGELVDAQQYPLHVYDDGTAKPASQIAFAPSPGAELIWKREEKDHLSTFKTDDELAAMDSEDYWREARMKKVGANVAATISAIQSKAEDDTSIVGEGRTKKAKFDYLAEWREKYRQGTLEAPDDPAVRFGRLPEDNTNTLAGTIRAWYRRNNKAPPSRSQVEKWESAAAQREEAAVSRRHRPKPPVDPLEKKMGAQ